MENLSRKAQIQEVELERTTKQLKEAIAIAGEETAKCKAAKEVIKSLTAQVRQILIFMNTLRIGNNHLYSSIAFDISDLKISNGEFFVL